MSKSSVRKHCSILNYVRSTDETLYDLIQDLCIGRMLVPGKNKSGITFLRPDKSLRDKIIKIASGDDPGEAVALLQSLVLLDYLPDFKDFDNKKSDIPTFLRKKLPVKTVDSKKVILENGAEITNDSGFDARDDRKNMAVYIISNAFVPIDTQPATFENTKKSSTRKKGGYEYNGQREKIFQDVLKSYCEHKDRDAAMETLVCLCDYLKNKNPAQYLTVCSLLSWDTLATLAIVLQPYRGDYSYITADVLKDFSNVANQGGLLSAIYGYAEDIVKAYEEHRQAGIKAPGVNDFTNKVKEIGNQIATEVSKINIIAKLATAYEHISKCIPPSLSIRKAAASDRNLLLAESELRMYSALLYDNSGCTVDYDEASQLFKQYKLNEAYLSQEAISSSNLGYYFSTAFLIARSNTLFYLPNCDIVNGLNSSVANERAMINVDKDFEIRIKQLKYGLNVEDPAQKALKDLLTAARNAIMGSSQ